MHAAEEESGFLDKEIGGSSLPTAPTEGMEGYMYTELDTGKGWKRLLVFVLLVVPGIMLLGCQTATMGYRGATLAPSSQIPLAEGPKHSDHYQTLDVTIDYEYVRNGDAMQLSGVVRYGAGLQHNFVLVPQFYMRLYFADAGGNVLSYHGVPISGYGYVDDVMRFSEHLTLPPGTAFMAFGYNGYARDTGGKDSGNTETRFFYDPAVH
jgi:hypothetical protein